MVCDDSKPLRALAGVYDTAMINRPDPAYMEAFGKRRRLTWNMSKPIAFASSADAPTVKIADIVAGATAAVANNEGNPGYRRMAQSIFKHFGEDCILPDLDIIDLTGDEAPVNLLKFSEELADRADNGFDPCSVWKYYEISEG